jgi:hypothetical protein
LGGREEVGPRKKSCGSGIIVDVMESSSQQCTIRARAPF